MSSQNPQIEALGQMLLAEVTRHSETMTRMIAFRDQATSEKQRADAAELRAAEAERKLATEIDNVVALRQDAETA